MHRYFKQRIKSLKSAYYSQTLVYILGIVVSFILMIVATGAFWGSPSEILGIYSFLILIVCLAKSVDFEITHPFIWFNTFFLVYSLSTPIMYMLDEYIFYTQYSKHFDYPQLIFAQYLAALAFALTLGHKGISYDLSVYKPQKINSYLFRGSYFLLIFGTIISLYYLYGIVFAGVKEKTGKIVEFNPILALSFCWTLMTVAIVTIMIQNKLLGKRFPFGLFIIFTSYFTMSLLVGGDRHPIFYNLLSVAITIHIFYKKVKFRYFLLVLFLGMYFSTISGAFKMFLLADYSLLDIEGLIFFDYKDILLIIVCSEFRTASENLAVAMQAIPLQFPFLYGEPLLADLMTMVIPSFLFPREAFETSVFWFNKTFFPNYFKSGAGVGFSLVGAGYVNFGYPGIVGLFLFLGWAMRKLYERSANSLVVIIFYLCFMPIFVLSIRGDLATIVSQGLKHILTSILIMIVFGKLTAVKGASVAVNGRKIALRRSFRAGTTSIEQNIGEDYLNGQDRVLKQ